MYGIIVLGAVLAIAVTSLRWIDAKDRAAQRAYESDGK